jgi:hypothetical protein
VHALVAGGADVPALTLILVVAVLAAVQSVFGVGLLVFGTPTLLLLGLPFPLVLAYLLPCSLTVSCLQLRLSGGIALEPVRVQFLRWSAPGVLVATLAALLVGSPHGIKAVVGVMLLLTAGLRFVGPLRRPFAHLVRGHLRPFLLALGVVHGLSNLGGGLLTVVTGTLFEDKTQIRRTIAFCYGLMAAIQLVVVLAVSSPPVAPALWLLLPPVAALVFNLVGQRLFTAAGAVTYQSALTAIIAGYGVLMLAPT